MRYFVSQSMTQQPAIVAVIECQSAQLVADENSLVADTQAQNIATGEVGKVELIIGPAVAVLGNCDDLQSDLADVTFQFLIDNGRDTHQGGRARA